MFNIYLLGSRIYITTAAVNKNTRCTNLAVPKAVKVRTINLSIHAILGMSGRSPSTSARPSALSPACVHSAPNSEELHIRPGAHRLALPDR